MSVYSTRQFTRRKALALLQATLDNPATSNEDLGDMLDVVLRPQLYNALVVPDHLATSEVEDLG